MTGKTIDLINWDARKRVPGHGLLFEGAPFVLLADGRYDRLYGQGVGGRGHAKCQCGAVSEESLQSGHARKKWHRAHKAEVSS